MEAWLDLYELLVIATLLLIIFFTTRVLCSRGL